MGRRLPEGAEVLMRAWCARYGQSVTALRAPDLPFDRPFIDTVAVGLGMEIPDHDVAGRLARLHALSRKALLGQKPRLVLRLDEARDGRTLRPRS
jgi:hypothetical protein